MLGIDFEHVEFTLGGDPALPIRVLVSVPIHGASDSADSDSGDSDGGVEVETAVSYDWRRRFIELVFGPAVFRLSSTSISRSKGAGILSNKKWHIHPSDWVKVSFEVNRILVEKEMLDQYL